MIFRWWLEASLIVAFLTGQCTEVVSPLRYLCIRGRSSSVSYTLNLCDNGFSCFLNAFYSSNHCFLFNACLCPLFFVLQCYPPPLIGRAGRRIWAHRASGAGPVIREEASEVWLHFIKRDGMLHFFRTSSVLNLIIL